MKRIAIVVGLFGLAACQGESAESYAARGATAAAGQEAWPGTGAGPTAAESARIFDAVSEADERRVVYVDVRRPDEWAEGHVAGAIHIPYTELPQRLAELEEYRDDEIVLYCRTGRRSGIAEEILRDAGFERLHNGGGLRDLEGQGVPVSR
jgi:phage shock protein E